MDFGIFNMMQQRDVSKSAKTIFDEALENTIAAEDLGFAKTWSAEHHFSNYSLCPSPLMMAAHVAAKTKRIRVGTAVVVAPLYTPARLLAEIGMVDTLSEGRLDLGIGMGYQSYEFERFGLEVGMAPEHMSELLDVLMLGMTQSAFEYSGKYVRQPRSAIAVRPYQKPTPPIYYAGSHPDHLRWLARNKQVLFMSGLLGGVSRMKATRDRYAQIVADEGGTPADVKIAVNRMVFVSDDRKEVESFAENALWQQRLAVSLKNRRETVTDDYIVEEKPYDEEPTLDSIIRNLPVGDVDTCVEKLTRIVRELNPTHITIPMQVGGMDHKASLRSLERIAREVIPAVLRNVKETVDA